MLANRRGIWVALIGLALQTGLIALAIAILSITHTAAAWPALWLIIAPAPLWLLTSLLFYCRYLEAREAEDIRQLAAKGDKSDSLFVEEDALHTAARRREWMEKWLVGVFSAYFGINLAGLGIGLLEWIHGTPSYGSNAPTIAFFAVGGAFAAFLFSRYANGMAKVKAWRLLRAPGSFMFANAIVLAVIAVVLGLEYAGVLVAGRVAAYLLGAVMFLIGAEIMLNRVMDWFRPRIPGVERRFAYDSRALSLIANFDSIGHSIAEALNYQFGFEITSSWFYRLLQRAFVPLVLTGMVLIWLMTSVIVVEEGESYVVLRSGQYQETLTPRGRPHLIWPWPINTTRRFETSKAHQILLGVGAERKDRPVAGRHIYLWADEHGDHLELDTLVAVPPRRGKSVKSSKNDPPDVMLLRLVTAVYYTIEDPKKFGYNFADAPKLLESVAHREMVTYAASATLTDRLPEGAGADRPQGIMTFGRGKAASDLKRLIAQAVGPEGLDLGVKIVRVEIQASHPPPEIAPDFEGVIAAERERDRMRYEAEAEARKVMAQAAGDVDEAWKLAQAITFLNQLKGLQGFVTDQADRAALIKGIDSAVREAETEADRIREEIHYQRLLGRLALDASDPRERQKDPNGQEDDRANVLVLQETQDKHIELLTGLREDPAPEAIAKALATYDRAVDKLFLTVGGQAAAVWEMALAERWQTEFKERAMRDAFPVEQRIYEAAPQLYVAERRLAALTEALAGKKKIILAVERELLEIWLDLQDQGASILETVPIK